MGPEPSLDGVTAFPEARARAIVAERSGGRCEAVIEGVCLGRAHSMHHRRKPGRLWNPSNLLHLCGDGTRGCHGWIEAHPTKANELGLWLMNGDGMPSEVSVQMRWESLKSWFVLDDEGSLEWDTHDYEALDAPDHAARLRAARD